MCNSRSPSRGEKTVVPHPVWTLQLQNSVERARAGDGVHRRGAVSEGIQPFSGPKTPRRSARPDGSLSCLPPDQLPKSPGAKSAAISRPSGRRSSTTRRRFALWTCPSRMQESTAAWRGISSALCTTPSTSRSKVSHGLKEHYSVRPSSPSDS